MGAANDPTAELTRRKLAFADKLAEEIRAVADHMGRQRTASRAALLDHLKIRFDRDLEPDTLLLALDRVDATIAGRFV